MSATNRRRAEREAPPPQPVEPPDPPRRRGRPPGTPSLTREIEDTIVSLVGSGATLDAASRAAAVSPRTVRGWVARGEDRDPRRGSNPKVRRLAKRVRTAQGEATVVALNRLFKENPRAWLARTDRSAPEDGEWSDGPARTGGRGAVGPEIAALSEEELNGALRRLLEVISERLAATSPPPALKARRAS